VKSAKPSTISQRFHDFLFIFGFFQENGGRLLFADDEESPPRGPPRGPQHRRRRRIRLKRKDAVVANRTERRNRRVFSEVTAVQLDRNDVRRQKHGDPTPQPGSIVRDQSPPPLPPRTYLKRRQPTPDVSVETRENVEQIDVTPKRARIQWRACLVTRRQRAAESDTAPPQQP